MHKDRNDTLIEIENLKREIKKLKHNSSGINGNNFILTTIDFEDDWNDFNMNDENPKSKKKQKQKKKKKQKKMWLKI